jgi:hypothetical protein
VAQAVELGQGLEDVGLGGDDELDVAAGDPPEGVDALDVERIGERHLQPAVHHLEGDHAVALGERPRHLRLDQVGVQVQRVDPDVAELGVGGNGLGDVELGDRSARVALVGQPELADQVVGHRLLLVRRGGAQPARQGLGLLADGLALLGSDVALAHQDVGHDLGSQVHRSFLQCLKDAQFSGSRGSRRGRPAAFTSQRATIQT